MIGARSVDKKRSSDFESRLPRAAFSKTELQQGPIWSRVFRVRLTPNPLQPKPAEIDFDRLLTKTSFRVRGALGWALQFLRQIVNRLHHDY